MFYVVYNYNKLFMHLFFTNFVKLDPDSDLHFVKQLDPDPHSEKLLDPDPQNMNADLQSCLKLSVMKTNNRPL